MARKSFRNFLRVFAEIEVDDAEVGVEISENVQLVYIADDLRQRNDVAVGVGTTEAAVVGEHGVLTLRVRTKNGVEIEQVSFGVNPNAFGLDDIVRIWATQISPTITGPAVLVSPFSSGFRIPECFVTAGTMPTASIPATAFRLQSVENFARGFFISGPRPEAAGQVEQFVNFAFNSANVAVSMGIRWRELRLYP